MTWTETNIVLQYLYREFAKLPIRTKETAEEYELKAVPLREFAIELHYIRIKLCQEGNYE